MTDKITVHPIKKTVLGAFSASWVMAFLLSTSALTQVVHAAEQEWWFDVEVIIFERNVDAADISEKFKQSRLEQPANDVIDLITPYLNPNLSYLRAGLPYCRNSNRLAVKTQYEQDFSFPLPSPETEKSSVTQTDKQLQQPNQQSGLDLSINPDEVTENTVQYDVTTTNIFVQPTDKGSPIQSTDASSDVENISLFDSSQNNSTDLALQTNSTDLALQTNSDIPAEFDLVRPPIKVEFIEWQIPSEFLCAYAEQIDPSFASMNALKEDTPIAQSAYTIKRVPDIINGIEWQKRRSAFLLPTSTMYMRDLYEKIKGQRDITPILHLNWRQEVKFSRAKGQTFRLFAGENFAQKFDTNGLAAVDKTDSLFDKLKQPTDDFYIPEQELADLTPEQQQVLLTRVSGEEREAVTDDLLTRIATALADDTPVNLEQDMNANQQGKIADSVMLKELWRLDGGITVYLRNINRIPYLHIDSTLDFRQPIFDPDQVQQVKGLPSSLPDQSVILVNELPQSVAFQPNLQEPGSQEPNFLQSVNFNQLRRVISKQVHYFDHPLFGMIVRLNRYRWPEEEEDTEINNKEL